MCDANLVAKHKRNYRMSMLQRSLMKRVETRPPKRNAQPKDFSPLSWEKFFTSFTDIEVESNSNNKFRVYINGTEGPSLVLLHGGGYSALTWSLFTREIVQRIKCKVLAIDIRGHGETRTENEEDLSIETLISDIENVLKKISNQDQDQIVIIGHSMGGALAVHCANKIQNCVGLCVIDVVEGTALEALSSMQTILRNRPNSFLSIEHAIQWCYRSGQTLNVEAARVSMPGQIKNMATNKLASTEIRESCAVETVDRSVIEANLASQTPGGIEVISEENEGHVTTVQSDTIMPPPNISYTWRINLSATEKYWKGWFEGLSELFLQTSVPKLLLLANIHGLDTALTVGQMQGKFQFQVLPKCGHAIHEDLPEKVADIIATYLIRQKLTVAVNDFTPTLPGC